MSTPGSRPWSAARPHDAAGDSAPRAARRLNGADRVKAPPHVFAYRFDDDRVVVLRLLHGAMDLPQHLERGRIKGNWYAVSVIGLAIKSACHRFSVLFLCF